MASKSWMHLEYERIVGGCISLRQWQRIRKALGVEESNATHISLVQNFARLRKLSPRARIGLQQVQQLENLLILLANVSTDGAELMKAASLVFKKMPSERTFYRWGKKIGTEFSRNASYNRGEMHRWVELLVAVRPRYNNAA